MLAIPRYDRLCTSDWSLTGAHRSQLLPETRHLQDVWGWGASLLAPFAGNSDPMTMFGLGEDAAPAGPVPEQGFFGTLPAAEPAGQLGKQPAAVHAEPAAVHAEQGMQAVPSAASALSELVRSSVNACAS